MSAYEPLYHVPRSQTWPNSRGGQTGHVHLHVTEDVVIGRIRRRRGQPLCGRPMAWFARAPQAGEELCPRCKEISERPEAP